MSISVPCRPQPLIALKLLVYVANHIGAKDQSNITSNHLILLENVKNAVTLGSPWWSVKLYRKHTSDLEWVLKDWYQCTGLHQFFFNPSPEVDPVNDVALHILQAFYKIVAEQSTGTFWALKRGNAKAQEEVIAALNMAVYGVTGNILFDMAEAGDDQGILQ